MSMMAGMDMGRILLDLSDEVIKRLDDLKVQRNLPRAELLREAVEQYLRGRIRLKPQFHVLLGCGKAVRKMVLNTSVNSVRNGNGQRIRAF
ncbi:Ribbon-helix-helix protein, copG family [Citrobacter freundii]|nr:Ribbon-helix-helix protein, copG family [Citrobacter freundii]